MANLQSLGVEKKLFCIGSRAIKARCRTFLITEDDLSGVRSIEEFRRLVKKRYRDLMRKVHSDTRPRSGVSVSIKTLNGKTTNIGHVSDIRRRYEYLMNLTDRDFKRAIRVRSSVAGEVPMPLDWEPWPMDLPSGYQETRDYLTYQ